MRTASEAYAIPERDLPVLPIRTVDAHAISIPARTFTGDFYRLDERPDGEWFLLGDVAGKGLDSAVLMAMVHEEVDRLMLDSRLTVASLVTRLHRALSEEMPIHRFVSLVAGRVTRDGLLELVNAGHCPPLLLRRNGEIEVIPSSGPVLGPLRDAIWTENTLPVMAGDALVVVSDGVIESESASGQELEVDGLVAGVRGVSATSSRQLVQLILRLVREHSGGQFHDDLTILALIAR